MDNQIRRTLKSGKAFIPFITAGDPDLVTSLSALKTMADNGADIIELGVPFTDPIADGETIQKSAERALQNSFSMQDIFRLVKEFRGAGYQTPILLMTYANPIFALGFEQFVKSAVEAGIDAALITDLPPEEAEDYLRYTKTYGLGTVFLCSPTTSLARLKLIDNASSAFVYYVARAGVTGTQEALPVDVVEKLEALKANLTNPLCVGFGVSTPEQAQHLKDHADGIIVGSALVKMFARWQGEELLSHIAQFTKIMKGSIRA